MRKRLAYLWWEALRQTSMIDFFQARCAFSSASMSDDCEIEAGLRGKGEEEERRCRGGEEEEEVNDGEEERR